MCFHDKPTRNDENPRDIWRAPSIQDGDKILFDECGRCAPQVNGTGSTDYHSHHFRVVQGKVSSAYRLLVRHGGGDEEIDLGYSHTRIVEILAMLDSDARYLMLHALYSAHNHAARKATDAECHRWREAAAMKWIKTRKQRNGPVKVWIERPKQAEK